MNGAQRIATEEVKAAEYEGRAYVAGVAKKEATTLKDAKMPVDVQKQDQI